MQERERIEGTILYITFSSPDTGFTVLELQTDEEMVTVVGEMVGLAPGQRLVVWGNYTNHPSFGVQFKAQSYEVALPEEENAILLYLSSGAVKGIGPATAKRIVKAFGRQTFEILARDPVRLSKVKGISYKQALAIQEEFKRIYGIQDVIVNLAGYGLSSAQAIALYSYYGENTVEAVNANPYILCDVPCNIPFEQADEIAQRMMLEYDSRQRVRGGIFYVLRHNANKGHSCVPADRLVSTVSAFIGVEPEKVASCLEDCCDEGQLFAEDIKGTVFIYLAQLYTAEMVSCQKISRLLHNQPPRVKDFSTAVDAVQKMLDIKYAPNQIKALEKVMDSSISIITGGPGTGKTTLVKGIITLFEMQAESVSLCAPTGRAAKRLSELSGRKAKTIHRLLEVVPGSRNAIRFSRNKDNPLPCDVLIVDECSMVDIVLFSQLVTATKDGCRIVLVGDYNQLPSVGAGNVLKDLLECNLVPAVQLTDIFRQAQQSDIVVNAHAINHGKLPMGSGRTGDYFFMERDESNIEPTVASLISTRLPSAYGYNNFDDIQIICPSRKKRGGTANINALLQSVINPESEDKKQIVFNGITFREGDKVMQIKNNYDLEYTGADGETEIGVFNGDIGRIVAIDTYNKTMTVRFDEKDYVYRQEIFGQLEHAWAITVHKSQGSEFKAVVLCISDTPAELQYRNLLYTAFTRAKELLVVVGRPDILQNMVTNDKKQLRYSGVKHFLEEYNV